MRTTPRTSRRTMLIGLASTATALATVPLPALARDFSASAPPIRYPEPDVIALDPAFAKYRIAQAPIERLHTGMYWAEGPAWSGWGNYLVWSDIPNDVQLRWLLDDGQVTTLRKPCGQSNGNTFDQQGRQVSFEHANRRVVRHEPGGTVTVLADAYDNKPLNAPNDGVVHPDGSLWFTDPGYGSMGNYEGNRGELHLKEAVYRLDPGGRLDKVTDEIHKPNGLCFSPDYARVYVADTGAPSNGPPAHNIKVWDVAGAQLKNGREFASMKMRVGGKDVAGFADGIRCDTDGNIWAGVGWVGEGYDGVHVFAPDGRRIGQIVLPEICANLCFGGPRRNRLFMTASRSLYSVYTEAQGAHWC